MGSVVPSIIPAVLGVAKTKKDDSAAKIQAQQIEADRKADEDARKSALRSATARKRAQFGASGLSPDEGSAQAVLLGLFEETEADLNARSERDSLRSRALSNSSAYTRGRNLLDITESVLSNSFKTTFLG